MECKSTNICPGVWSKIRNNATTIYISLLFFAGYVSSAIYPSFVNAITHVTKLQGVSIGALSTA